ncbi:MAG: hypothetical protein ABFC24_12350 [Methanoregulaceae archaeon]
MISAGTILQLQAALILQTFTTAVYTTNTLHLSRSFGDLAGTLMNGSLVIIKLKECALLHGLDTLQAETIFANDIRPMRCWSRVSTIRSELWILNAAGSWQFFEIPGDGIREVFHDG